MSNDTQAAPIGSPARQIAFFFGQIADTTEWDHAAWQALTARLIASGKPVGDMTLIDVLNAIVATAQEQGKWA